MTQGLTLIPGETALLSPARRERVIEAAWLARRTIARSMAMPFPIWIGVRWKPTMRLGPFMAMRCRTKCLAVGVLDRLIVRFTVMPSRLLATKLPRGRIVPSAPHKMHPAMSQEVAGLAGRALCRARVRRPNEPPARLSTSGSSLSFASDRLILGRRAAMPSPDP